MLPALGRAAGPMMRRCHGRLNSAFFQVIQVERNVMFLILSAIILWRR